MRRKSFAAIAYLWRRCGRYMWVVAVLVVMQAVLAALSVQLALINKALIDHASGGNAAAFRATAGMLVSVIAVNMVGSMLMGLLRSRALAKMDREWKTYLSRKLLSSEYTAVTAFHTGELLNRLTNDVATVNSALLGIAPGAVALLLRLVLAAITLLKIEPVLTFVLLAFGMATLGAAVVFKRFIKPLSRAQSEAEGRVTGFLQESLGRILMVQALDVNEEIGRRSDALLQDRWKKQMQRLGFSMLGSSGLSIGMQAIHLGTRIYCAARMLTGNLSFGSFTAVAQLVGMLEAPFVSFSSMTSQYFAMSVSAERLQELDNLPQESATALDGAQLYRDMQTLSADGLCFSYEDRKTVLQDVSFEIPKGSFVVVTGESGSGKSTLLKLLLGLLHPDSGSCYAMINGSKMPLARETRGMFAYVPPGNMLLSGTIRENLLLTRPEATEEELAQAIRVSCLDEVIAQLPAGLETVLGENALGLSDGQAQRVNIARAVLSQAPVMLLDEATSALDLETEQCVLERLVALEGRTWMMVTHRPSAFQFAKLHINILENGNAVCEDMHSARQS